MRPIRPAVAVLFVAASLAVAAPPQTGVKITDEPSHHLVLSNLFFRVFDVQTGPHASTLLHHHSHDYLYVTLGAAKIVNAKTGETPATVALKDGEVRFTKGGIAHRVTNAGDQTIRNITIELLRPSPH